MTNIYVGFHDQRNSSRILKPPGGGTSSIFGGELVPDVVPQNCRKEIKHRGSSIQDVLQTQTVSTTVTRREEKTTSGSVDGQLDPNIASESVIAVTEDVVPVPDVAADVTCKVEQLKIEERSSKSEVTETDSAGNSKVVASESNSEGSVEQNSSFKQGSSIGDILQQEEILEKKKIKGPPTQRVPPGGFSSGLW